MVVGPCERRLLTFQYQKQHPEITSDQDKILYPSNYLNAFIDIMLEFANRDYDDNVKMQKVMQDAIRQHNLQQSNPGPTDTRPIIQPANSTRLSIQASYGSPMAEIDWGPLFDNGAIYGF